MCGGHRRSCERLWNFLLSSLWEKKCNRNKELTADRGGIRTGYRWIRNHRASNWATRLLTCSADWKGYLSLVSLSYDESGQAQVSSGANTSNCTCKRSKKRWPPRHWSFTGMTPIEEEFLLLLFWNRDIFQSKSSVPVEELKSINSLNASASDLSGNKPRINPSACGLGVYAWFISW